jgi:hypothetical protein
MNAVAQTFPEAGSFAALYPNHNHPWRPGEEEFIRTAFEQGYMDKDISAILGRTPESVRAHRVPMGLNRKEQPRERKAKPARLSMEAISSLALLKRQLETAQHNITCPVIFAARCELVGLVPL